MKNLYIINSIMLRDNKAQKNFLYTLNKKTIFSFLNIQISKTESAFYTKILKAYQFIETVTGQKPLILKIAMKKKQKQQNLIFYIGATINNHNRLLKLNMYYLNVLIPLSKHYNLFSKMITNNILALTIYNINLFLGLEESLYFLNKQKIQFNFNFFLNNLIISKNYETLLL